MSDPIYGDRYELHRRIGRGGMAEVHLGRDRLLDRPVAIKVLFPEFSRDTAFVERFRREAQNVANLSHPNIVGVYDWGEHDDTYYMVMEYVEGRTLADILRVEGTLHPDRAAEIGIDVAEGLSYAHRNGVIHRDIKPGNVLVTDGGQVKVADFGIAQAVAVDDADHTAAESVMGTAAYLSPEQAQGRAVDPRSDLYSLGCVLYEMLTSRPPFTGDTPVAIAYKQVQEQPTPPSQLASDVPQALDAVTMKLLAKNPANRYPSAADAGADLRRFRQGQPVVAEAVQVGDAAVAGAAAEAVDLEEIEVEEPPRRVGVLVFSLVILLLVLAGLLGLLADTLGGDETAAATGLVPDVVEMDVGEAREVLSEAGFFPKLQYEENDDFPENVVFAQDPPGGTKLEEGSDIVLSVSSGGTSVIVPEVVGLQSTAARSLLESSGFLVDEKEDFHEVAAVGEVIRQDPAPDEDVPIGSIVTIVVSKGPEPVEVPELEGRSEIEAANALGNLGFEVAFFEEESADVEEGKVIRTDPPAGEKLAPGGVVTVIMSTGKFVELVDLVGLRSEEAINVLRGAELQPSIEPQELPPGHPDDDRVLAMDPAPGEKVERGSVVVLRVGIAPAAPSTTEPRPTTTVPPRIDVLTINPSRISTDQPRDQVPLLTWSASGGDSVLVEGPGVNERARSGSTQVCPGDLGSSCVSTPGTYRYRVRILVGGRVVEEQSVTLTVSG